MKLPEIGHTVMIETYGDGIVTGVVTGFAVHDGVSRVYDVVNYHIAGNPADTRWAWLDQIVG